MSNGGLFSRGPIAAFLQTVCQGALICQSHMCKYKLTVYDVDLLVEFRVGEMNHILFLHLQLIEGKFDVHIMNNPHTLHSCTQLQYEPKWCSYRLMVTWLCNKIMWLEVTNTNEGSRGPSPNLQSGLLARKTLIFLKALIQLQDAFPLSCGVTPNRRTQYLLQ